MAQQQSPLWQGSSLSKLACTSVKTVIIQSLQHLWPLPFNCPEALPVVQPFQPQKCCLPADSLWVRAGKTPPSHTLAAGQEQIRGTPGSTELSLVEAMLLCPPNVTSRLVKVLLSPPMTPCAGGVSRELWG